MKFHYLKLFLCLRSYAFYDIVDVIIHIHDPYM